ncbi:MAG: SURF1 family protein [Sphingomonadales bacterium]|jgi:surfeit locus 1 family protein|nr:SURF1 family protein [Sphingomonadales bacterium]MBK9005189.1 SURF1 family protein [Sphingomonadales bacterium]MBK9267077.1 SURF1 family protein [Sphingomonadales bacterium]MBP6434145.1 SURF1 family protein [Sphingorhabdus sp.]
MRLRLPLLPTVIVGMAVATMIALGFWQLQRKAEKEALIALYAANADKPPIAFPHMAPVRDAEMFRKSTLNCLEVVGWQSVSGRDTSGKAGFQYIADCSTGPEGPGALVAYGIADRPDIKPDWKGGMVNGTVVTEPSRYSFIERTFGAISVPRPMIVAGDAPEGMRAVAQPDPKNVTNNHLSYALQWFFFAAAALVIYLLALRRRQSGR